jgi:hypothetical protein
MSFAPEDQLIVCISACEEMNRNKEAIAGQLWIHGDRMMTASNRVLEGMANTRDSAILSAAVEAVNWRHAGELPRPRKGQRVIIFPKELPQLEAVLFSNDLSIDPVDGHSTAYDAVLQGRQQFEIPPIFLREDSDQVVNDPIAAEKVQGWMAVSKQVAVGNRRRVPEDGADKVNSSDEEDEEMKPDELTGMYTSEMDPKAGPRKLTPAESAYQLAAAVARKEQMILSAPRVESPQPGEVPEVVDTHVNMLLSGGSSDDDDLSRPEHIWSQTLGRVRKNKAWTGKLADAALALPAPEPERQPRPMSSDTEDQAGQTEDQKRCSRLGKKKAAASPRAPAGSHPMVTREARRAGSLRSGGGSGQTDTRVASGNPSKT